MFVFREMALCPSGTPEVPLPLTSPFFSLQQVALCHQVAVTPLLVQEVVSIATPSSVRGDDFLKNFWKHF